MQWNRLPFTTRLRGQNYDANFISLLITRLAFLFTIRNQSSFSNVLKRHLLPSQINPLLPTGPCHNINHHLRYSVSHAIEIIYDCDRDIDYASIWWPHNELEKHKISCTHDRLLWSGDRGVNILKGTLLPHLVRLEFVTLKRCSENPIRYTVSQTKSITL